MVVVTSGGNIVIAIIKNGGDVDMVVRVVEIASDVIVEMLTKVVFLSWQE